ncbi:hypothetical protein EXIGLDRAFT_729489 [Exidia glandulosa HHB12029]|uniref:Uncharacterized protein n=1 Tax=Exidia glandulosa HHB12029 TaxID=1314781 RepID=A0A165CJM9_EXIGL|nr:hypothetical protein EXIGLDRAFT_729489 [Exidia glandulosa HHB12029]
MNALKSPFLGNLRASSTSRSSTPAPSLPSPDHTQIADPFATALAPNGNGAGTSTAQPPRGRVQKLSSLTPFKRAMSPAPPAPPAPAQTLVQDGSYLQALGLKLSEAVSKAVSQPGGPLGVGEPTVDGKRALPSGRGKTLGALIASELRATEGNPNLQRAVLRLLQRPLSVLLTTLNAHLLPLISSRSFSQFVITQSPGPFNATQTVALSLAGLAAEVLETFDSLGLGAAEASSSGRGTPSIGDGLRGIREGLESIVTKVLGPMFAGIRKELHPVLDALEQLPLAPSPPLRPVTSLKPTSSSSVVHPSLVTLSHGLPSFGRALQRLANISHSAHASLASCLISLVWRAMVALAYRPVAQIARTPPVIPTPLPLTSSGTAASSAPPSKTRFGGRTPPGTPSATRFLMKLPSSRPPSPPSSSGGVDPLEHDAKSVYDLLQGLPRPPESNELAREAVVEAFEAYEAFLTMLSHRGDASNVPEDVPTLIALPVLLRAYGFPTSVAQLLELGETEYREGCVTGFGRAAECGPVVAKRILEVLGPVDSGDDARAPLVEWLQSRSPTTH